MKKQYLLPLLLLLTSCTTMNDSLELGAGLGFATGAGATYAGFSAGGNNPSLQTVAIGAGVGTIVGLATSYFTHRKLESDRQSCQENQIETHFGDLPPSPFVVPKTLPKKGGN
jgi:hypothetical protein